MNKNILFLMIIALLLCGCQSTSKENITSDHGITAASETETQAETGASQPGTLDRAPGSYLDKLEHPETEAIMEYYLFIPEGATENMPLIIFLHGSGEVGRVKDLEDYTMITRAKEIYGDDFPFIVLSPCAYTNSWTTGGVPEMLKELIDQIVENCKIDSDRVIITGHSIGATGVYYMVSKYGDFFSAAVPVSCPFYEIVDMQKCTEVPIWIFTGNFDEHEIAFTEKAIAFTEEIAALGGNISYTCLDGCDHTATATEAYSIGTFVWMLKQ